LGPPFFLSPYATGWWYVLTCSGASGLWLAPDPADYRDAPFGGSAGEGGGRKETTIKYLYQNDMSNAIVH